MSLLHGGVGEITQSERRLKFIGINVLRWSSTACHPNQIRSAGTAGGLRNPPLKSHAHGIANDGNPCKGAIEIALPPFQTYPLSHGACKKPRNPGAYLPANKRSSVSLDLTLA